ncbi:MAG: hypothetical protein ABI575_00120 [Oxalobacteraceae bacterium]
MGLQPAFFIDGAIGRRGMLWSINPQCGLQYDVAGASLTQCSKVDKG